MCTSIDHPEHGRLGSLAELRAAGFEIPPDAIDPDWPQDACLCGVDTELIAEANGLDYIVEADGDLTIWPTCAGCGTPHEKQRKWNSGNPKDFWIPQCTCLEEATERRMDEMLADLKQRRAERADG